MRNLITRPSRKFLSGLIVLALALAVAGCSALRFSYVNADTLSYWWLDRYVGFTHEQAPWVKDELAAFFAWHRNTQLPEYARVLSAARQRLNQPVSAADVHGELAAIRAHAARSAEQALPALSRLALSLSPRQIDAIERKFASNNDKYRKEHLQGDVQERQQARHEKVMKQAEHWFGRFDLAQKERIRAASDARPLDHERWLAERQARQQALLALLRKIQAERPDAQATATMLRAYIKSTLDNTSYTDNGEFLARSREATAQMIARIINLTTPKQKAHASERLQKLIADAQALAGSGAAEAVAIQID